MLTNKTIATAVVTALVGQAAAFNSHRHLHRQVEKNLDKRALDVEWVTAWETVYVTAGQEPEPTPEAKAEVKPEKVVAPPAPEPTTVVVVEPSQPPAPVAENKVEQPEVPAPQPTTLVKQIKKPEPSPEPVVEAPVVENPVKPSKTKASTPKPSEESKKTDNSGGNSGSGDAPFSSKRGIAYNDAPFANLFATSCKSCSWGWNWGSSSSGLEGVSFVPTLWGPEEKHVSHWDEDCEAAIAAGSKAILSFNEPDQDGQASITADQAAADHAKWMNKYSGQALVGSPSITNGVPFTDENGVYKLKGLEYLQAFMDACHAQDGGCAIDFCQIHWYSEAAYVDTLYEQISKAHEICDNKPIWLTEFAPLDTDPSVKDDFMKTVIPELEKIDYLHAYSYFMVSPGNLMSSSSALSTFGELYASV